MLNAIAFSFLKASITCGIAAAVIVALLALATRVWPVLAGHRSVWLWSQSAIAGAFVVALLPQSADYSVVPAIEIARPAAAAAQPSVQPQRDAYEADGLDDDIDPLELLAQAWLALYVAGLLAAGTRWVHAQRGLRALLDHARPLDATALAQHAGFDAEPVADLLRRGLRVCETDASISPMLAGLARPHLLLPRHLRSFSDEQQRLIVAHELTHWKRHDPLWLHASMLLQTLFWFNPLLAVLTRRLNWAQELGCDHAVLDGRPAQQRKQYAAALVAQLKVQQESLGASIAFGHGSPASLRTRVGLIREQGLRAPGLPGKAAVAAALASVLGASLLLQPAFAWRAAEPGVSAPSATVAAPAASAPRQQWQMPLERVRVTSFYGAARKNLEGGHHGIDFAARTGTPILAAAGGTVVASTAQYEGGPQYGDVVLIEHADGVRSLYAHLSVRSVKPGQVVRAGETIGLAGETGKVTGPHLHLEAFRDGERIDPQQMLTSLDALATSRALRKRPARL
ncbi:peptidoglycan DD-metalloendopeptidase family protein [Massilia sp. CCM 8733]|uniref:Peptidoglycan DD-metalloendopeptidase family protein n=1 Tax=Massilia mucilaginosa TaxID=2609282 RepID=A0ABX0NNC4_9BURK|nr:M23/M56 family metallopeptidase [Massilia mucilaginosa]NHZ88291.1 peptidoglycan DD-metalloendopeptidase family protein [Massilia mucilaginosa]